VTSTNSSISRQGWKHEAENFQQNIKRSLSSQPFFEEEDVTTTTLAEDTENDMKKPESKALSASFSPNDIFSTSLFKDDPALLQFTKKVEKQVAKFEQHFEVPYTGKLNFEGVNRCGITSI